MSLPDRTSSTLDQQPGETTEMPTRPYTVLHANLPFYVDPDCRIAAGGASLIVLRCDDPKQTHHPIECMPTTYRYAAGQTVG